MVRERRFIPALSDHEFSDHEFSLYERTFHHKALPNGGFRLYVATTPKRAKRARSGSVAEEMVKTASL